jgi:hypothetical protein
MHATLIWLKLSASNSVPAAVRPFDVKNHVNATASTASVAARRSQRLAGERGVVVGDCIEASGTSE